ncbi:MAG TPA: glycosyltransferase family 9 protein [Roseateles sp.]
MTACLDGPVRRIVVLRALMLGDMLCALPALRAIRRAWPKAHIAVLGLPVSRELLSRMEGVDEWLAFPGWPGLPEHPVDVRTLPDFLRAMQGRGWDLAIQLHGSGQLTNPLLQLLGAGCTAGFYSPGALLPPADAARYCPWPQHGHETQRLLALCTHLGLPLDGDGLQFPLRPEDDAALRDAWPGWDGCAGYACVHAGAQLPSRRWPVARFAAVAEALHDMGFAVVLTGTSAERALADELAARLHARGVPAVDLVGRTTLWSLGALLRRARVLVCNDTGVSHIAAALRVPSVVLSCGSDAARWAPPDRALHRVLAMPAPCRPCAHAVCPTKHECAEALTVDTVLHALHDLLSTKELPCPAACAS